ncbi:Helix-turn-helix domain-containing protein [Gracilibacillus ureilyticus]|uniref:Helix-turn-helix domain-containing protein n=1 Tax=Gracilibacillus ureilyticus TaxID=531814 RepID=A0A1H9TZ17_9BACI|nr:AraC family transcriptional regulator [Gracilibacillus ureilyticus]SES02495.1 Helix-turn-helix domain-containing protein [Gracilibacillus ureilyticus]
METIEYENETIWKQQTELVKLIEQFAKEDGVHSTAIPALHLIRASNVSEPISIIHEPALCIVVQGKKVVTLGQESYYYDVSKYLVVSVDLPISGQVIQASSTSPYLCLRLDFQPKQIFDILRDSGSSFHSSKSSKRGLFISETDHTLFDAIMRLVRLLETPKDIPILSPLIIREILYRILSGEQGDAVKQIAMIGSNAQRVASVIDIIKRDYNQPLKIDTLAKSVNMSTSSLHYHFKEVTAMSPLQYQKQLRLQEARRMMLSESMDAANAGFQVGYESPSQFSREYARLFGAPPMRDIKRFKIQSI